MIAERFLDLPKILKKKSLSAIALEINFTPQSVTRISRGKSKPSYELLVALVENYNLSAQWLLVGDGPPFYSGTIVAAEKVPQYRQRPDPELLEMAKELDDLREKYDRLEERMNKLE